jgi:hypothetical protein
MTMQANDVLTAYQKLRRDQRLSKADRIVGCHVARRGGHVGNLDLFAIECRLPRTRVEKSLDLLRAHKHINSTSPRGIRNDHNAAAA